MTIRPTPLRPPACQCPTVDGDTCVNTMTQEDMLCDQCREGLHCQSVREIAKILGGHGEVRPD